LIAPAHWVINHLIGTVPWIINHLVAAVLADNIIKFDIFGRSPILAGASGISEQ
jgi:hypothetical protein